MMDPVMYRLSRIYGHFGGKAQKYSLVNPKGLPGNLRFLWHAYRVVLVLILLFAFMLFWQSTVIFWSAFAAAVVALYVKGSIEEKLDHGLLVLHTEERSEAQFPPKSKVE